MPNWSHSFYRDPAYKQKIRNLVSSSRSKRTPAERELHNARIALAYRRSAAVNLFDMNSYSGRRDAKKWIAIAEERLRKAEVSLTP